MLQRNPVDGRFFVDLLLGLALLSGISALISGSGFLILYTLTDLALAGLLALAVACNIRHHRRPVVARLVVPPPGPGARTNMRRHLSDGNR